MKLIHDLVTSRRDGSVSLTKIVALVAHVQLAIAVALITISKREFNEAMWLLYLGVAVGHAAYDKTAAMVADFKDKRLKAESQFSGPGEFK